MEGLEEALREAHASPSLVRVRLEGREELRAVCQGQAQAPPSLVVRHEELRAVGLAVCQGQAQAPLWLPPIPMELRLPLMVAPPRPNRWGASRSLEFSPWPPLHTICWTPCPTAGNECHQAHIVLGSP